MEKREWKKPVLTVLELTDDIILASPCNDDGYCSSDCGPDTCLCEAPVVHCVGF